MGLHSLAPQTPVVLAVLTTTCPFCTDNLDAWQRLSTTLAPDQFVALTLDPVAETQAWLAANGHSWPVVRLPRSDLRTLGLSGVPTTLVLSTEGEVLFAQNGMLREDDVASVRPFVTIH
jgi:hypothetical protein